MIANPEHRNRNGDIAVIGMGCVFPGADGPHQFWRNIVTKQVQIGNPQPDWGAERYINATGTTRISTAAGGYLRELYSFDPAELGVMPNSIDGGEPDQYLALKVARDALADAACLHNYDHANSGIVLGHSTYLHRGSGVMVQHGIVVDQTVELIRHLLPDAPSAALEKLRAVLVAQLPPFNADTAPGLVPNVMTGRIANRFNMRGPNYLIDGACASSLLAVKAAMEELRSGRSDLMLAGGVNASIPPAVSIVFTQLGALSQRSDIRPFDADADGTLLAEGLGIIVLKRLDDAVTAGDRIYAVLKGIGQSSDGKGGGLLAPQLEGEALAIRRAYQDAGLEPRTIGLIEAHGTGVPLGDRTEVNALSEVFGKRAGDRPHIALGSVKSLIGHCLPAAGIAGLIKAILALHYKVLPPTRCGEVNNSLGMDQTKFYINSESRPWIVSLGTQRRAGVNAFGFGGVNSHAVIEEAPAPTKGGRPVYWGAELLVLSAPNPERLIAAIDRLQRGLAGRLARENLAAMAAALARDDPGGVVRLAIVAKDLADLARKLDRARERIATGSCRFKFLSGIYCADEIHGGKLALAFPGEGGQYEGMLADVLAAFPEARQWFDFWDALYDGELGDRPSECVYPASTGLNAATKQRLEKKLFGVELGSEAAFVSSQALLAVTRRLGLRADAVVGHSGGEHGALFAAAALSWTDWHDLEVRIRDFKRLYQSMTPSSEIAGGALLAVGAVPRQKLVALAEEVGVHVALDNCPQQMVLYGQRSQLDAMVAQLTREGGLCAFLPFNRPYHTPLFAPSADIDGVYRRFDFQVPATPIYSCVTSAPMPSAPDDIRKLVASQWRSRVCFTETVERMYADGVRTFVEIGASASLTGFIENILRGKDVLAIALDSRRRSSLVQMLHAFARLWSAGISLDIRKLYDDRSVVPANFAEDQADPCRARVFANTLPFVEIPATTCAELRAALLPWVHSAAAAPERPSTASDVAAYISERAASIYPFIDRVVSHDANGLVAECDLDVGRYAFLRQHSLWASEVSDLDPNLTSVPTVPLAVGIELLAEVAAALVGGVVPIRLEEVRSLAWIALDDGPRTIRLEAALLSEMEGLIRVSARIRDVAGMSLAEAVVVLADARRQPDALEVQPAPLMDPQPSIIRDEELYLTGMFHGPMFQSVKSVAAWDAGGVDVWLANTPLDGFFQPGERPTLLLNPILLDAVGQVTAFWICQYLGTDFSCFPSGVEAIDLYDAGREDTEGCFIAGRLGTEPPSVKPHFVNGGYLNGEFTCFGYDGAPLFRMTGWRDRFFQVPSRFFFARFQPRDGFYGENMNGLFTGLPDNSLVWRVPAFPAGFLDDAGGIWRRVLVNTILSAQERLDWKALRAAQSRRDEWLIGRTAIKDVARAWIERVHGVRLMPADLVVKVAAGGRPYLAGNGLESVGEMPEVSVAHVAGQAVAIAAPRGTQVGIDLDVVGRVATADLLAAGFSDAEQAILMDTDIAPELRVLKAWCAKEAAAKCLGTGLNGQPKSFVVSALDDRQGWAHVVAPTQTALGVLLAVEQESVLAVAFNGSSALASNQDT